MKIPKTDFFDLVTTNCWNFKTTCLLAMKIINIGGFWSSKREILKIVGHIWQTEGFSSMELWND